MLVISASVVAQAHSSALYILMVPQQHLHNILHYMNGFDSLPYSFGCLDVSYVVIVNPFLWILILIIYTSVTFIAGVIINNI